MVWGKTWTVVFRCYNCGRKFTVRHVTFDQIEALHAVYPCPFCAARPIVKPAPHDRANKAHHMVELSDEMEMVYRKYRDGDTWHFDPDCSQYPVDDYLALDAAPRTEQLCNECSVKSRRWPSN
jgi:DNA-directed RNA polymerase subunit RPC12/RpoP